MVPFLKSKRNFRLMRPVWLALMLSLLASLPTFPQTADSSQPEGTISGTVLDEHGQPFKGVQVCTYMLGAPEGSKESRGDCPATTDEAGKFRIDHVAMGTFGVEAIKLEDGYVAFAGTSVKDKFAGKPVTVFEVSWAISNPEKPNSTYSGGQTISRLNERAIVPPEKYLVLTISARGYEKWVYHDPSDPSRPATIRLQPGEEKELLVELEPQAPEDR